MTVHNPATRRRARSFARAGAVGSAVMLAVTGWSWLSAAAAPSNAGSAQIVNPDTNQPLTSGGSKTHFTLKLPAGAACTGDSANQSYRVQSYMVPSSVDPASLQYASTGPTPTATGTNFREPLYDINQNPYVNQQTAAANPAPGPGPIINIPAFDFEVYTSPGLIPAGTYNVGIACTLGPASTTQLDKYWNTTMTFTSSSSDTPAGIAWTAQASTTTTTTAASGGSTTTTAGSGGTTTTIGSGGTTTTTTGSGGTTTTTASGGTTTTTTASGSNVTVTDSTGAAVSANSVVARGQQLTVSATGFALGETVTIVANSTPVSLGTAVADSAGKVTASVTIPASLDAGAHTLTLTGAAKTATFPFTIAAASSSSSSGTGSGSGSSSGGNQLPFTGSDPFALFVWAALLVVFGRMAILLGRPLRQRGDRAQ